MKTLYLLRHAKSSWDDRTVADFDRPLNGRGERAAPFMGKLMLKRGQVPDAIVSSPAQRASQTAELAAAAMDFGAAITLDARIYEASTMRLLAVAAGIPETAGSALIVGHNPGIEGFIWHLTGKLEPMPTAALAIIELAIDAWTDIHDNCGSLVQVVRPKEEMDRGN